MKNLAVAPEAGRQAGAIGHMNLNGREIPFYPGESILQAARREAVDIPSFCYHSELSAYGACRLCLVEVEGRGLVASCSAQPEDGLVVRTETGRLRHIRRTILELLLARHQPDCPACAKEPACRLRAICQRLGVTGDRPPAGGQPPPRDESGIALVRDPGKCILCGDCVRICREVQGLGILDFAHRGSRTMVVPAFGRPLGEVDCVNCGQCAAVCPTAAIIVRSEREEVRAALEDPGTTVVAQLAPAVRVALGEEFGLEPGEDATGLVAAALRRAGFDRVYDTVFAADVTTVEETHEFEQRLAGGGPFPHLTSCCPAWVKYCEQYAPDFLANLSTCKSPQQMLGSLVKRLDAPLHGLDPARVRVVSIMPCTAKKFEARRPEHGSDVDWVLSTVEAAQLVREAGVIFTELQPEACDNPLGMVTGGGILFGASGGVTEAVLREALDRAGLPQPATLGWGTREERGGLHEAVVSLGSTTLQVAVVSGLGAAAEVLKSVREGRRHYHLIEIMACPGGCVGGGGQPAGAQSPPRAQRRRGLDRIDRSLQLRVASHNPFVRKLYADHLQGAGSETAHSLLHTTYAPRRRMAASASHPILEAGAGALEVSVCVGTGCFLRGSHALLENLLGQVRQAGLEQQVRLTATFCLEQCDRGVSVRVGEKVCTGMNPDDAGAILEREVRPRLAAGRDQA